MVIDLTLDEFLQIDSMIQEIPDWIEANDELELAEVLRP